MNEISHKERSSRKIIHTKEWPIRHVKAFSILTSKKGTPKISSGPTALFTLFQPWTQDVAADFYASEIEYELP